METLRSARKKPEIFNYLHLVGRIALSVGVIATAGLIVTLYVLTDSSGVTYGEVIRSSSIVQSYLGPALLVGGCILVAFTATITWLIALYSTFRIAGPLFRFSHNLETAIANGPIKPIPLREGDSLQQEAALFGRSLGVLEKHYADLREEVELAIRELDAGGIDQTRLQITTARLMRLVKRVQL